jgi:hypothetical protein
MPKSQMSKSSTSSRGSVLERTIDELYRDGPERADAVVFGREVGATRRDFVGGAGLAAMSAAVGGARPAPPTCPADGRLRLSEQHSLGASRAAGRKPHVLTFRLPNALKRTLVISDRFMSSRCFGVWAFRIHVTCCFWHSGKRALSRFRLICRPLKSMSSFA